MTQTKPVILPPPHAGEWALALDPDGKTVTLAMMDGTTMLASETGEIEGGWVMEINSKRVPTLKSMAEKMNTRAAAAERLRKELGGINVVLVHVANMEAWRVQPA